MKKAKGLYAKRKFSVAVRLVNCQKAKEIIEKKADIIKSKTYESDCYADASFVFECDIYNAVEIANQLEAIEIEASNQGHTFSK